MTAAFTVLLCVALFTTVLICSWTFAFHDPNTDAAGRGLAQVYTALGGVALMVMIGVLLGMCASRGSFNAMWGGVAIAMFVGTAVVQITALAALTGMQAGDPFQLPLR